MKHLLNPKTASHLENSEWGSRLSTGISLRENLENLQRWESERQPRLAHLSTMPKSGLPYADDFIVTGKSKRLLEKKVKPVVVKFLAERGLTLSEEKTKLTHIKNGFTFLGQTFRKRGKKLHIKPSKEGVLALIQKVGTLITKHVSAPMPALIKKLNQTLRGWANYHRHVVAGEAFIRIDTYVFEQLWRMLKRRHQNKSKGWLIKKYWSASPQKYVFAVKAKTKENVKKVYQVVKICNIGIRRFVKIIAAANPYMPEFAKYFWERRNKKDSKLLPAMSAREYRAMAA